MQKRDFEILPNFSETHVFRGTICHPFLGVKLLLFAVMIYYEMS